MNNRSTTYRNNALTQRAGTMFEQIYFKGKLKGLWATITGKSRAIPFLSDENIDMNHVEVEQVGVHPIRINQIIGTLGRMNYDKDFYPLQRRDKKRWMSVAIAMMNDVTSLGPISVVQVGDDYYTSDGNHRVSVARTLDKLYIDAKITRWISPSA